MNHKLFLLAIVACLALALTACRPVSRDGSAGAASAGAAAAEAGELNAASSVEEQIASALSAAPQAITQNATIMGITPQGETKAPLLRQGTNDWTCTPDDPNTPGTSPECANPTWLDFWSVATLGEKPDIPTIGLSIMLQGGTEANTADPTVTRRRQDRTGSIRRPT